MSIEYAESILIRIREGLLEPRYLYSMLSDRSAILVDTDGMQVLSLNPTAAFILTELKGASSSSGSLVQSVIREFAVTDKTAAADIQAFLSELDAFLKAVPK